MGALLCLSMGTMAQDIEPETPEHMLNLPYAGNNDYLYNLLEQHGYTLEGKRIGQVPDPLGQLRDFRLEQASDETEENTGAESGTTYGRDGVTEGIWRVPVSVWVYRTNSGTGGATEDQIGQWLNDVNDEYRWDNTGVQFYLKCDVTFVDDDNWNVCDIGDMPTMWSTYRENNTINLHFVDGLTFNSGQNLDFGVSSYPKHSALNYEGWMSSTIDITSGQDFHKVIVRHLAHCLRNLDTHSWGQTPLNGNSFVANPYNEYTNKDATNCTMESVSRTRTQWFPCTMMGLKKCDVNGDFLCDTEADPLLVGLVDINTCQYTGIGEDNWNDAWQPDVSNFMSLAPHKCRHDFTAGQVGVMLDHLINGNIANPGAMVQNDFDVYENDNSATLARDIMLGERQHHTFHWQTKADGTWESSCDEDWAKLEISATTSVRVYTSEVPGRPTPNTKLWLYDASLNQLAYNDDFGGTGLSQVEVGQLPVGTYYIKVGNKSNFPSADSRGHYYLDVEYGFCDPICPAFGNNIVANPSFTTAIPYCSGAGGFTSDFTQDCQISNGLEGIAAYTVTDNPTLWNSSWSATDHTPGGNTSMLVGTIPGATDLKVWKTDVYVEKGKNYYASVWVKRLNFDFPEFQVLLGIEDPSGTIIMTSNVVESADGWVKVCGNHRATSTGNKELFILIKRHRRLLPPAEERAFAVDDIEFRLAGPAVNAGADRDKCPGTPVVLSTQLVSGYSYQWHYLQGTTWVFAGNSNSLTVNDHVTRTYRVTVTQGSCVASDEVLVTARSSSHAACSGGGTGGGSGGGGGAEAGKSLTDATGEDLQTAFTLFPNPANESVTLRIVSSDQRAKSIEVLSLGGQRLKLEAKVASDGDVVLPIHDLANGVYLIRLLHQGQMLSQERLVIMR